MLIQLFQRLPRALHLHHNPRHALLYIMPPFQNDMEEILQAVLTLCWPASCTSSNSQRCRRFRISPPSFSDSREGPKTRWLWSGAAKVQKHPTMTRFSWHLIQAYLTTVIRGSRAGNYSCGCISVTDYSIRFCILPVDSGLSDAALVTLFRNRLSAELQMELPCWDADLNLDALIALAIKLDQHFCGKQQRSSLPSKKKADGRFSIPTQHTDSFL